MRKRFLALKNFLRRYWPHKIAYYYGTVTDIAPPDNPDNAVYISFDNIDDQDQFARIFPRERLALTGADFPGAQVKYSIWSWWMVSLSFLSRHGPTAKELLKSDFHLLSEDELARLDEHWNDSYP